MRVVAVFDPITDTSDTFNAGFSNGTGKIVVHNESPVNLQLSWGSFSTYCPCWMSNLYCVSTNNVNINWQAQSTLNSTDEPISQVVVEAYDSNEPILGTYPAPLVRQTNIGGGTVNTNNVTTQTLYNNGFAAHTQVVSVGVLSDLGATWTMYNDGTFLLFLRTAANTYVQAFGVQLSEPYVQIGIPTHKTEIDGLVRLVAKLLYDGADNNLCDWTSGGVFLKGNPASFGPFHYQSDGTNTDIQISATSHGSGTSAAGSATFNHNLKVAGANATPDVVLITPTGGQFSYAVTAKSSTQFTLSASAAQTFDFVAIKF